MRNVRLAAEVAIRCKHAAWSFPRVEMMNRILIGQDPLSIERHFFMMTAVPYSFMVTQDLKE
jgi:hypothetical protein